MRKCFLFLFLLPLFQGALAQDKNEVKPNYLQAAKFSPNRLNKMVFSTSVDPHWLKRSNRFWYSYQTSDGRKWYIVDPAKGEKKELFNNDKLAALLTTIIKDPIDGQHLELDSLQFTGDETTVRFQVKSSIDIIIKDTTARRARHRKRKRRYFILNTISIMATSPI